MTEQPTFLIDEMDQERKARETAAAEERHMKLWRLCWGWDGPKAGGLCEIDSCVVRLENGGCIYAYTEQTRLIGQRPDGAWLGEIQMGVDRWWGRKEPFRWPKDGTRVILCVRDIWPPTRQLRETRENREQAMPAGATP